jgi:hypothetical protein
LATRSPSRSSHTTFMPGGEPVAVAQRLGDSDRPIECMGVIIGITAAFSALPEGHAVINTLKRAEPVGESQCRRGDLNF